MSPVAQQAQQTTEQQRLNSLYTQPGSSAAQTGAPGPGNLLSGESSGNQTFMNSLTQQVSNATSQARQRIAALATAGSYGGSFGGLGTTTPITFMQGGNAINLQNAIRQGNLKTYGVEQQVQPINYAIGPGTSATESLAKGLTSLGGSLAGMAGPRAISGLSSSGVFSGLGGGGTGDLYNYAAGDVSTPSAASDALFNWG